MEFQEFAQLLHPVIGGGSSTHSFVRTLFDAIVTDEGRAVLEEVSESTYKAYYNGTTGISRFAKKINTFVEPAEFEAFCNDLPDAAVDTLCDQFRQYLPDINPYNAAEKLSILFQSIIHDAATTKRKSTKKKTVEQDDVEIMDAVPHAGTPEDKKITVIQHQTNVVQNGENNFNLTNNGTMNFNF